MLCTPGISVQAKAPERLVVTVGKSLSIDSPVTIKRVAIANTTLAETVMIGPRELLINGLAAGETSLVIWQEGEVRLVYDLLVRPSLVKVDAVRDQIASELPDANVELTMANDIVFTVSYTHLVRDRSLDAVCAGLSVAELLAECDALDGFRRASGNLYERVRALFFLYAIHRFHMPLHDEAAAPAAIPFAGYTKLLKRRFEEAIDIFLAAQAEAGAGAAISSALAAAYRGLGFQTLAGQVRHSVRSVRGNQWMFRIGHPADYPLRLRPELLRTEGGMFPLLRESTPVRMDLTHSGWSDIFFLGMDFPEGARVINISVDLAVRGGAGAGAPKPPVEAYLRVIDQPVLRLTSVDLQATAEISTIDEIFDFARDYLSLLKAAAIASGLVPPGMEGATQPLAHLLERLTGARGLGIEIVSKVNGIPKGSRLAVSTTLLASLIAACMRATGQVQSLEGELTEDERRLVAARAILGEWLGGSGGGWQDSGGVWPGIKLIHGVAAAEGDAEFGVKMCIRDRPWDTLPGRAGTVATNPPSASRSRTTV